MFRMNDYPATIIIRHKKENLKKCSLSGLEQRPDFFFFRYPLNVALPSLCNYILLTVDAESELSIKDQSSGLLIIDGTWAYAEKMMAHLPEMGNIQTRRVPENLVTAYPRRQQDCSQPLRGLASIEAIYCSYTILKRPTDGLLDHYYWKDSFLEKNSSILLKSIATFN